MSQAETPTPLTALDLAAIAIADMRQRWQSGLRTPVESYLAWMPPVVADPEAILDLVFGEAMIRFDLGEKPTVEEYIARFPSKATELRRQFALQEGIFFDAETAPPPLQDSAIAVTKVKRDRFEPDTQVLDSKKLTTPVPGHQIIRELGRGGMGVVYLARREQLGRLVALKMILTGSQANSIDRERFLREAEIIAGLSHPNIVQIYEIGQIDGQPYFSLEYCEGGTLLTKTRGQLQPIRQVVEWLHAIAQAVTCAHDAGVIHRDLKPANILLTHDTIKVADFGLAVPLRQDDERLTNDGAIIGTLGYLSPEQAEGRVSELTPASDVFSLGAMLYELLVGRPPFRGTAFVETLTMVIHDDPVPPRRLRPSVPRDLENICLRCLEKLPKRRYPDARHLADDLQRFLDGRPVQARPIGALERLTKWAKRRPLVAGLSAALVASLFGLIAVLIGALLVTQEERRQVVAALARTEAELYRSRILLAQAEWQSNDLAHAEELLNACPQHLRGWEWRYLNQLIQASRAEPTTGSVLAIHGSARATTEGPVVVYRTEGVVRRFQDHTSAVRGLAFLNNGAALASASDDGTVRIYDLLRGTSIVWGEHGGAVEHLASDGGDHLAAVSAGAVRVREHKTGLVRTLPHQADTVAGIGFLTYRQQPAFLVAERTGQVRLWTLSNEQVMWQTRTEPIRAVAVNDHHLALAGEDDKIRVHRLGENVPPQILRTSGRVSSLKWLASGELAAATGHLREPGEIMVWNVHTEQVERTYRGHRAPVRAIVEMPSRELLATDGSHLRLWPKHDPQAVPLAAPREGWLMSLAVHPTLPKIAFGGQSGQLMAWTPRGESPVPDFQASSPILCLCLVGESDTVVVGDAGGQVHWLPQNGNKLSVDAGSPVWSVACPVSGSEVLAGCEDGRIVLWRPGEQLIVTEMKHAGKVTGLAWLSDGLVISSGHDQKVCVWQWGERAKLLQTYEMPSSVACLAASRNGEFVAAGAGHFEGMLRVWRRSPSQSDGVMQEIWSAKTSGRVLGLAFSRDGKRLASTGTDRVISLWEMPEGRLLLNLPGHRRATAALGFLPDDSGLVSVGEDGAAKLWPAPINRNSPIRSEKP